MDNNAFTTEIGRTLQGYPRERPDEAVFKWPDEDMRHFEAELFEANAHFLFENWERVFADSRMFLAPVNVQSGAAYIGPLVKPTIGTYIEWWFRRGQEDLAYLVSGSPLSGTNASKAIANEGSLVPLSSPGSFLDLVREFNDAHMRYLDERRKYEAYSLFEVVMRLRNVVPDYEDAFKAKVFERRTAALEKQVGSLQQEIAALKRRCQSYKDKYEHVLRTGVSV